MIDTETDVRHQAIRLCAVARTVILAGIKRINWPPLQGARLDFGQLALEPALDDAWLASLHEATGQLLTVLEDWTGVNEETRAALSRLWTVADGLDTALQRLIATESDEAPVLAIGAIEQALTDAMWPGERA